MLLPWGSVCRAPQLQADALARNDWQSWVVRERLVVRWSVMRAYQAVVREDIRPLDGAFCGELAAATIFLRVLFAAYKAVSSICSRPAGGVITSYSSATTKR